jgi:hypothetical protein
MSDALIFIGIVVLIVGCVFALGISASEGMINKKDDLILNGWRCDKIRYYTGQTHARGINYKCQKDGRSVIVGYHGNIFEIE